LNEEALKVSKKKPEESQHLAQIENWELDLTPNTLSGSDEVYKMFDLDPQQFESTYETFLEKIHPDDRETVI